MSQNGGCPAHSIARSKTPMSSSLLPSARFYCDASSASEGQRAVRQPLPDVGRGAPTHRLGSPSGTSTVSTAGSVEVHGVVAPLEEPLVTKPTLPSLRAEVVRHGALDDLGIRTTANGRPWMGTDRGLIAAPFSATVTGAPQHGTSEQSTRRGEVVCRTGDSYSSAGIRRTLAQTSWHPRGRVSGRRKL